MRVIQYYKFWIGRKIPFLEWPDLIQKLMEQTELHYGGFCYYFKTGKRGAKAALKDCPALAPADFEGEPDKLHALTNLEDGGGCGEEELMALMPKIDRRYGFQSACFIYRDVDFFSRRTPTERVKEGKTPSCFAGSQIILERSAVFPTENNIQLFIDIYHDGEVLDPSPYREAVRQLLPGCRFIEYMNYLFDSEEQRKYDALNQSAAEMIRRAEKFCEERMIPLGKERTAGEKPKISLTSAITKLCRQFGMEYVGYTLGSHDIQKRTARGHYIIVHVSISGWNQIVDFDARFAGLGFNHRFLFSRCIPEDQQQEISHLTRCFEILAEAEKEVLPALDAHYPPTPEWYVPHGYWANGIPAPGLS